MKPDEFAPDQAAAINAAVRWFHWDGRRPFLLYGAAGTGKSSIAGRIADLTAPVDTVFVAMTGKAAAVLEGKGLTASTIHSAIYQPKGEGKTLKLLRATRAKLVEDRVPDVAKIRAVDAQIKALSGGGFALRGRDRAFDGKRPKLIVVDEGSMVSERVARDLAGFDIPTLVLGDPYQLPPVQAKPGYSSTPDALLTTVHRQRGPLLDMATAARQGRALPRYDRSTRVGRYAGPYDVDLLGRFDQVIVHKNDTRWQIIDGLRAAQGREPGVPSAGDRIMVIRNDAEAQVVNGQQAIVVNAQSVDGDAWLIETSGGDTWVCDTRGFLNRAGQEAVKADRNSELVAATFAQAVTCYAAQGSEWPDVAVIDESTSREWLYTAVTRAQRECIVLTRKPTMTAGQYRTGHMTPAAQVAA